MFFYRVQGSTKHSNRFEHNDQWKRLIYFWATSSSEWNSIFQSFQKEDNLERYTGVFFSEVYVFHSTLLSELISRICWQMVPGNFCTMCRCFQILESFGWMESAHKLPWEAPLFQVFFFFLEDHAANRNNSEVGLRTIIVCNLRSVILKSVQKT